jgi:hypothetical protein
LEHEEEGEEEEKEDGGSGVAAVKCQQLSCSHVKGRAHIPPTVTAQHNINHIMVICIRLRESQC